SESTGEGPVTAKVGRARIVDVYATQPAAKLDVMHAMLNLREVVQFPAASFIDRMADRRTVCRRNGAAVKSAAHVQCRNGVRAERLVRIARELKTRFVDRRRIDDGSLCQLNVLVG